MKTQLQGAEGAAEKEQELQIERQRHTELQAQYAALVAAKNVVDTELEAANKES